MNTENITPIRQQYLRIKRRYPQVIVFFRLGDFYETFDDDALIASKELEIVLTSRGMGKNNKVPMAGIPYHAVDNYLARLINKGYKVAICEQMTRPGETKGIVQREVVRLVTPGTVVEPALLNSRSNNFLSSLVLDEEQAGLAFVDITTGEFCVTQTSSQRILSEINRLKPSEIIISNNVDISNFNLVAPVSRIDDYTFNFDAALKTLLEHFKVATLDGYGCGNLPLAIRAAGSIVHYLGETQKAALTQVNSLLTYSTDSFMALDLQTQNNLELFKNSRSGNSERSLLFVLDLTKTAMGGRLLKKWLGQPLLDIKSINARLDRIEWFFNESIKRSRVIHLLSDMPDFERLINRVKGNIASPRELLALKNGLEKVPQLRDILDNWPDLELKEELKPQPDIVELLSKSIIDQPPSDLNEGGVIKPGFSPELDELQAKSTTSKKYLANLERQERDRTGIKSLKVGFNRVFGYYLEVSNSNLSQVPQDYIRKQTLTGGERYFTPELKEYESLILHAQERIKDLENDIFYRVCSQVAASIEPILGIARNLACLDLYSSLAEVATRNGYLRPELSDGSWIIIKEGRHPVIERTLLESNFVPNDTELCNDKTQLVILTGPNMSGKSTYLRQVALIVLIAQIGSFVPASYAKIGIVDRIFTRIGAGEDLAAGKSTFMVEMTETANILNNATPRSLIILDEIGRGTSTYDGLSIARAVAEYIHNNPKIGAKTLFATHYHELVDLALTLPRVRNFNVAVTEEGGEVKFLRKIIPGGVDKSYGIHVAKLAGLPKPVIARAQEVLLDLENEASLPKRIGRGTRVNISTEGTQIPMFGPKPQIVTDIQNLDIESLTPIEALNILFELRKKVLKA